MPRQPERPLDFLDGLRGLAALWVLLHHARWLLWEGWEAYGKHPEQYSAAGKALVLALTPLRYGHQGVIFFFVLSGFVIHLGYARKLATGGGPSFGWTSYVARRARRLYPPLVLTMFLTLALDKVGAAQGWSIYHGATPYPLMNSSIAPVHDLPTAAGNLAFLMQSWVPCWGSNGPLWSLHFEWWFYMLYPLLWFLSRRSVMIATAVVGSLFALSWLVKPGAGHFFHVAQIFIALLTWWLGALLADIHTGRLRVRWAVLAPLTLLLPALPLVLPRIGARCELLRDGWLPDTLYGFGFAGLFAFCFLLRERGHRLALLARLKPLGDMSYTLYIAHMPVLVFLGGWLMSRSPDGTLPHHFGWFVIGAFVCLLLAWLAHFVVEKPFVSRKAASVA